MHPCIEHTLFSEGAREHAVKNTNVKHARMRVAGYKIWAGGGGEPRPTRSYPIPQPPHPSRSPPTTDDDVLTAGDPVNFISIVVSVNIGGLSTLSTLSSVSHFSTATAMHGI